MNTRNSATMFEQVYDIILERKQSSPDNSYVASLMEKGTDSILRKIVEESVEVILAVKNKNRKEQIHEITDLCFHMLVLMGHQGIKLNEISQELEDRFGQSGFEEKTQR